MLNPRFRRYHGLTLIEILIVITIIGLLTAVMLPSVKYQYRNRSVVESSQLLNAYIGAAQSRSQKIGRPVGIWIHRFLEVPQFLAPYDPTLPISANYSMTIYQAEVPPPYTGDIPESKASIQNNWRIQFDSTSSLLNSNNPLIRPGDHFKIRFDNRGPYFDAVRLTLQQEALPIYQSTPKPIYRLLHNRIKTGADIPQIATNSRGSPFTILRRPVRSFKPPLHLPQGAVIDLSVSGVGLKGSQFNTSDIPTQAHQPVIVMFQPEGGIGNVYLKNRVEQPRGTVHLLLGSLDQVNPISPFLDTETEVANIMDLDNRWISINHQNGQVTSSSLDAIRNNQVTPEFKVAASRKLVSTGSGLEAN